MQYEQIKLRDVFPALAKVPLEKLRAKREAYCREAGLTGWRAAFREPMLTAYCPFSEWEAESDVRRPAVLICPGGSYEHVSRQEWLALAFVSHGYNAFLLDYSVAPVRYPAALLELAASLAYIRSHAAHFHTVPEAVAVAGFSAGGHLAACLGTLWQEPFIAREIGIPSRSFRPDALILGYPVISLTRFTHSHSCDCLLGPDKDEKQEEHLSLDKRVSKDTPPTFLWHTVTDPVVPVENSLSFACALQAHHIPMELHLYPQGGHGLSLCTAETAHGNKDNILPHCATWFSLCDEWLHLLFAPHFPI